MSDERQPDKEAPMIEYECLTPGCSNRFNVPQGSRRRYCDVCYARRVRNGGRRKREAQK